MRAGPVHGRYRKYIFEGPFLASRTNCRVWHSSHAHPSILLFLPSVSPHQNQITEMLFLSLGKAHGLHCVLTQTCGGAQEPASPGTIWKMQRGSAKFRHPSSVSARALRSCAEMSCINPSWGCSLQTSLVYCSLQMRLIHFVLPSTLRSTSLAMVVVILFYHTGRD